MATINEEYIRNIVLDMFRNSEIQVESYINEGNYSTELVTRIATNDGKDGLYEILAEYREDITDELK